MFSPKVQLCRNRRTATSTWASTRDTVGVRGSLLACGVLALASFVAATSAASAASPAPSAPVRPAIEGTWAIERFAGAGGTLRAPLTSSERAPEITFNPDGTFWGHTGCNSFSGEHAGQGSTISMTEIDWTIMSCGEGGLAAQEAAILGVLQMVTGWAGDGRSVALVGGAGETLLVGRAVEAPITGEWQVWHGAWPDVDLGPGAPSPIPGVGRVAWELSLGADHVVWARAGCDPIIGRYMVRGAELSFEMSWGGTSSCGEAFAAQEQAFLAILAATTSHAVNRYRLTLMGATGRILESFHRPD